MTHDSHPEIAEIYDLLSAPSLPSSPEPAVVFGRQDKRVAEATGDLIASKLLTAVVITGGIGKDSGTILSQGFRSEANWLELQLEKILEKPVEQPVIFLDERATNGGENARFSLRMLREAGIATASLIAVVHATSARRLAETLRFESDKKSSKPTIVHTVPTNYPFDPNNLTDRSEAIAEFMRLIEWPGKGWLYPQTDLPENLVDFALDTGAKAPPQPSSSTGNILRLVPSKMRPILLRSAEKHLS
jgi:uncharacterized SAM-binding protein YcdF (DUF218 family)